MLLENQAVQSGSSAHIQDATGAQCKSRFLDWCEDSRFAEEMANRQPSFLTVIPADDQFCTAITTKVSP